MTLQERLRHYRKDAGKLQKDVHKETGIPQSTLSDMENGLYEPGASTLITLAKCYKVSVLKLLYDDPKDDKKIS